MTVPRFRRFAYRLRALGVLVAGCLALTGCPQIDRIWIENDSDLKIDFQVNLQYPDTTLERAGPNTYAVPRSRSWIKVVNRKWIDVIRDRQQVTVFFAEWKPVEFYTQGRQVAQEIYGKLVLTMEVLDSLGWVIRFPQDVGPCPACSGQVPSGMETSRDPRAGCSSGDCS
jgi:hypothetical protein